VVQVGVQPQQQIRSSQVAHKQAQVYSQLLQVAVLVLQEQVVISFGLHFYLMVVQVVERVVQV
jgi:hypothetical protein